MMNEPYFSPTPKTAGVEITNRCNLTCRHCFNHSGEGPLQELTLTDLIYLFDQLQAMGLTHIRLSGGEPTLHPDFSAIVRAAQQRGLGVSVNTHGVFSVCTRQQVIALPISLFIVSLDGLRQTNDSIRGQGMFDRAVETSAWLHELGRSVVLGVHLRRSNVDDVPGLIALAAKLGVNIKFSPLRPLGRARQYLSDEILSPFDFYQAVRTITCLRAEYPQVHISTDFDILQPVESSVPISPAQASCPAGRSMLNVNFDGYIYPCAFLVTPQQEFAAGHLRQAPLLALWQESPIFEPFRTLPKAARCQSCFAYGHTCVGGCPAIAYFTTGRLDAHDPTCFSHYVSSVDLEVTDHGCD